MKNYYAIIMAGGIGSRFWPMSTSKHPKQFLDILGSGQTLIQQTYHRMLNFCLNENIYVVTSSEYEDLVAKQLPQLPKQNILSEPARKNTAPCVAYASYKIHQLNPQAITIVAPSDHLIKKEDTFSKAVKSCFQKAEKENCLITLGIKPTRPDTGYGYIQFVESSENESDKRIKKVKTFTEKPDLEMARFFMQSGDFLWNAGIFVWSVSSIMSAFARYMPETDLLFREGFAHYNKPSEKDFIAKTYEIVKNISIDYAILEKADNVYVRSSIIGWSDLGTWGSLYTHVPREKKHNAIVNKNALVYDTSGCLVQVPKQKLVVLEGLQDYIIVDTPDVLLVCKKENEQQIRQFVNDVKMEKGDRFV